MTIKEKQDKLIEQLVSAINYTDNITLPYIHSKCRTDLLADSMFACLFGENAATEVMVSYALLNTDVNQALLEQAAISEIEVREILEGTLATIMLRAGLSLGDLRLIIHNLLNIRYSLQGRLASSPESASWAISTPGDESVDTATNLCMSHPWLIVCLLMELIQVTPDGKVKK